MSKINISKILLSFLLRLEVIDKVNGQTEGLHYFYIVDGTPYSH